MTNQTQPITVAKKLMPMLLVFSVILTPAVSAEDEKEKTGSDFPTAVLADYVLGCMNANGNSFESLHQCSCSIDFIKDRMTYAEYEQAQTIMRARLDRGQRGIFFRDAAWAKKRADRLEKLQAESTLRCF